MKTSKIKQWAALLLTFSGMAALNTARADLVTVSGSALVESNKNYSSSSGHVLVVNASGTYSGTNITLSNTANPNVRWWYGACTYGSGNKISLYDSAIATAGTYGYGFIVQAGASGYASNLQITTTGYEGDGLYADGRNSRLEGDGITINTSGANARGLVVRGTGAADLYNVSITTAGYNARGVAVLTNGTAAIHGLTVDAAQDSGISVEVGGYAEVENFSIQAGRYGAWVGAGTSTGYGIGDDNTLILRSGTINSVLTGASVTAWGNNTLELHNVDIYVSGSGQSALAIAGSYAEGQEKKLVIDGGTQHSDSGAGLTVTSNATSNDTLDVTITGGAKVSGATGINISTGSEANAVVTVENNSVIDGGIGSSTSGTATVNVNGGSDLHDGVVHGGTGALTVNLDNSSLTGDAINGGDGALTINGRDSSVTGTAIASGSSVTNINLSGPGSSWLGDVDQQDNSKIVINLDNGASGTGGFNGGDLIVGGGSEFTFDKDSHGNNGKNNGTWNIGDKDVKFDNLENNGKIIINVDTDSGTPKGSVSTDNGSGNGTIVINPDGSGTGNPNDILNNIVNGPGTDGWQWEDIDWGLKQYEVTPNPDGSLTIRETGKSSTVSALTQGLLAAQKSSWFAQQNSLLKRMGDLRLNAERTTNISGKDDKDVSAPMPTADALISNIWIRSYGAQYNYGTAVTGRGFKQYTYGVDIGTDHKWSLNADHDLYTGIFAGYGRADTDHRYNGSESNLNNYYAGLYASLLNNSGWYIDATLKAQYSDHELSGYHGGIDYFSAKYHNWSIGGSVEIGKKFTFQDDWFIEPQLQVNYLHILAEDYSVSTGQQLNVSDLDAFQFRAGVVMGRTLKLSNGGALQPYVKISGVEMLSTGGKVTSGYQSQRPNLDGARAELGAGIIWQLDAHNQLHLDYEASFGDKYDKPWGLTAGYRYQF